MSSSVDFGDVPLTLAANPFRPGMGIAPPHLAGREAEQGALLAGLEQLRSGQPVNGPAVKTAAQHSPLVRAALGMGGRILQEQEVEE